jgi:hypothetical protein
VNRVLLVAAIAFAIVSAACGGGSGTSSTPPPPTGNFSNANLKGSYAFSMSGQDGTSGSFLARVGSFNADGNGNITAALEDVNVGGSFRQAVSFTGTYSIQSNGKGTLTLNGALGGGLQLSIALNSASQGVMTQTDLAATSSGNFSLQSATAFSNPGIAGNYVFDVSGGATSNGAPVSAIGEAVTDGNGNVTGGVFDTNDGNSTTGPSGPQTLAASTYAVDTTSNGTTFGRGTITLAGLSFVFYIVDSTHLKLLEEDTNADTLGDALKQPGGIPATTAAWSAGSFVFAIGGSGVLGTAGPVARAGRFTTSGSGTLSTVALDDNNDGTVRSTGTTLSNTTYAIDATAGIAGSGRGTLTFTDASLGTFSFVFYLVSPTQAVIQDTSAGIIGDGTMLAQSGTISASSLAGNYVFNWSGVVLPSSGNVGFEEDFVGQYAEASSASLSGAVDFVELGTTSNHPLFSNSAVSGSFSLIGNGNGSNDYKVTISSSGVSANTFNFKAYIAAGNTVFLVGADSNQIIAGNASLQTQ